MQHEGLEEKQIQLNEYFQSLNLNVQIPDYSSPDYWNRRYEVEKGKSYEW
jgi:hypothetical protein